MAGGSVVDSLLIVTPIVELCYCSMFCCVYSSFAIISMGKKESSWCPVVVVWLFLTMPRVCLQFVIVGLPDHTQYFLWKLIGLP